MTTLEIAIVMHSCMHGIQFLDFHSSWVNGFANVFMQLYKLLPMHTHTPL